MAGLRILLACGIVFTLCTVQIQAGEVCSFEFIKAVTIPGKVTVFYNSYPSNSSHLNIMCNIDGGAFKSCPNGTFFDVTQSGSVVIRFTADCPGGSSNSILDSDLGPFPVNVPGLCPSTAQITDLKRNPIYDEWKNEMFTWKVEADTTNVDLMCQINDGPMSPCSSPFDVERSIYDSLCSRRHRFTVTAMCEGSVLGQGSITTRIFNGIACNADNPACEDISFETKPTITSQTTVGDSTTIVPSFSTNVASFCFCKSLRDRRLEPCNSGNPTTVKGPTGVFVVNCEARDGCNTIIRYYIPFS